MRIHRAVLVIAGMAGVVVVARSMFFEDVPRQASHDSLHEPGGGDPIAALQRDVGQLKQRLERPRFVLPPAGEPRSEATSGSTAPDPPKPKPIDPAEISRTLDAHHASEPTDRAWGNELQAAIGAAITEHPIATTLSSVQCGTSLCKVSLQHDNVGAQRDLASHVASLPALGAGVFYHYEDGEHPRTVLYIVRQGHAIGDMLATQ